MDVLRRTMWHRSSHFSPEEGLMLQKVHSRMAQELLSDNVAISAKSFCRDFSAWMPLP